MKRPIVAVLAMALLGLPTDGSASVPAAARPGSVNWDDKTYVAGTGKFVVRGKVPGGKRTVRLQVRTKGSWRNLRSEHSLRSGRFALKTTLDWHGGHKLRVLAPGRPAYARSTHVVVSPGYVPVGKASDYKLLKVRRFAKNWTFDPCGTVRYKVNADDVGPDGIALVKHAMELASMATGIPVKYTGTTNFIPRFKRSQHLPGRRTNLVVAWATTQEVPEFIDESAGGLGGPVHGRYAVNARGRRVAKTMEAHVVLRTEWYPQMAHTFSSPTSPPVGHLLLHEIGHAYGLGHSVGTDQMMYGHTWSPDGDGIYRSRYAAGDLKALRKVGLGQGCLRQPSSSPRVRRSVSSSHSLALPMKPARSWNSFANVS